MEQNKLRTYFFYALGEVFLVVIGILIALQVNNWNSERISDARVKGLLHKLSDEIELNIQAGEEVLEFYARHDSLFDRLLSVTSVTKDFDPETDIPQLYLVFSARAFNPETKGGNAIIEYVDADGIEIEEIVNELKEIETTILVRIKNSFQRMDDISDDYRSFLVYNTPWFSDFYKRKSVITEDIIAYFLNDPVYVNNVRWYRTAMTNNYVRSIRMYNHEFRVLHGKINGMLKAPAVDGIDYVQDPAVGIQKNCVGKYVSTAEYDNEIEVNTKDSQLALTASNGKVFDMYFINDSTFFYSGGLKGECTQDGSLVFKTDIAGYTNPTVYKMK